MLKEIAGLYDGGGPNILVTDKDLALRAATLEVFPNTKHMLYRWHVAKDCRMRLVSLRYGKTEKRRLMELWKSYITAETEGEFGARQDELERSVHGGFQLIQYLRQSWIPYKDTFVSAWINMFEHYGIATTSRIAGSQAMIKDKIKHRYRGLNHIFDRIDERCKSEQEKLEVMAHKDKYSLISTDSLKQFTPIRDKISIFCFKKIRRECNKYLKDT